MVFFIISVKCINLNLNIFFDNNGWFTRDRLCKGTSICAESE